MESINIKTFDLTNKIVAITGGYGYLASAIVKHLLHYNAKVYVLGRNEEKFKLAFNELLLNDRVKFLSFDIASQESIDNGFTQIEKLEGKIDVLINNAFYLKGQSPEDMTNEDFEYGIDGTLNSVFRCIKSIIPIFKKYNSGKIINMSSMYGMVAPQFEVYDDFPEFLNPPHYGAAKAGVIQLTKYYAAYLGKNYNIQVNCVSPGPFPSTNVQEKVGFVKNLEDKTCLKRIGNPEDLAGVFTFLSSSASDYITGQNITVDGGWTVK